MKKLLILSIMFFCSCNVVSCSGGSKNPTVGTSVTLPETPQILPLHEVSLGSHTLKIMIARSVTEKTKGLMFYEHLPSDQGMLFVYDQPQILTFWMKNTKIPLDLVFFSSDLRISEFIEGMTPGYGIADKDLPRYPSKKPAQYALELASGTIKALKLRVGDQLIVPLPLLFSEP